MSSQPPRLRDVAARAGVHMGTVSRALNIETRSLVNPGTAARILQVARELGYQPNPVARGLKTSRTASVGVVIPDLTNPFFPPVVRGIEDALAEVNYSALVVNTDNDAERESRLVASLRARQVEGLIFGTARLDHDAISGLAQSGIAVVVVNRRSEGYPVASVSADDRMGIAAVVRLLVDTGHRAIAHLAGPQWSSTGRDRAAAFQDSLRECRLRPDPRLLTVCDGFSVAAGERGMNTLSAAGARCTALVAGNDLLALGCYRWLAARGLQCPADLSVTGFNGMPFVDMVAPPLTTVAVPNYEMGLQAGRLLLERIRNPAAPVRSVVVPTRLLVRESVGAPATGAASSRPRWGGALPQPFDQPVG